MDQRHTTRRQTTRPHSARRRSSATALAVVLAAGLFAGCSADGEDSTAEVDYVDAVAKEWQRTKGSGVTEAQARCWGQKVVDRVGIDRVRRTGLPSDFGSQSVDLDFPQLGLDAAEASAVYDDFGACGADLAADRARVVDTIGLPDELAGCMADGISEETMAKFFRTSLESGQKQASETMLQDEALESAMMGCVDALDPATKDLLAETTE
ncbi:hypothetical protein [Nocardioides yefusunii]|uniref:Lipoprotein n=1 Tax=Nocardioides yefusunii TaxID=2500546 RepID=A0ABW1QZZ4_9ACTN|nr:hypothetical protein [Nocardioides yefusunii]